MSEVTAVPLRPIKKGSLTTLWLGLGLLVAIAITAAFWSAPARIKFDTVTAGSGPLAQEGGAVQVNYSGKFADGKEFDSGQATPMLVQEGATIPGFHQALRQMRKGGKYKVYIPAALGYGAEEKRNPQTGEVVIPANSDLVFDIEVLDMKTPEELNQLRMQQQMMQNLQGQMPQGQMPQGPSDGR